jgi:hypothetical protein
MCFETGEHKSRNGLGDEITRLRADLEAAKAERDNAGEAIEFLRNEIYVARTDLAARDLVIKQMRMALQEIVYALKCEATDWENTGVFDDALEALTLQPTTDALDAYVEQYKVDAEKWQEYQARKVRLTKAGFGKSPLRGEK